MKLPTIPLKRKCPMCGKTHTMPVDYASLHDYVMEERLIQEAFPELNATEREYIKSGYCMECQRALFGDDIPDAPSLQEVDG